MLKSFVSLFSLFVAIAICGAASAADDVDLSNTEAPVGICADVQQNAEWIRFEQAQGRFAGPQGNEPVCLLIKQMLKNSGTCERQAALSLKQFRQAQGRFAGNTREPRT